MRQILRGLLFLSVLAVSGGPVSAQDAPNVTLASPANRQPGVELRPTYSWTADPASGTTFELQVATNLGFSPAVLNRKVTDTSVSPQITLRETTLYYWRVRGVRAGVFGPWTPARTFTTTPTPGKVTLIAPGNGAKTVPVNPSLAWTGPPPFNAGFRVEMVPDSTGIDTVVFSTRVRTPWVADTLAYGVTYRWHVQGRTEESVAGPWSDQKEFTTEFKIPGVVVLVYPPDQSIGIPPDTSFQWTEANPPAEHYEIELRLHSMDADTVILLPVDTLQGIIDHPDFDPGPLERVFWRVRGVNADGIPGEFSQPAEFRIADDPPGVVTLESPADEEVEVSRSTRLTWIADPPTETYRLSFGRGGDPDEFVVDTDSTFWQFEDSLEVGTTYTWKVHSINADDRVGAWSLPHSFTTKLAVPDTIRLLEPADGDSVLLNPEFEFTWRMDSAAATYEIQVALDTNYTSLEVGTSGLVPTSFRRADSLERGVVLFWRVKGVNARHVAGAWSVTRSFKTAPTDVVAPTLVAPVDGADGQPTMISLAWSLPEAVDSVIVHVATDSLFVTTFDSDSVTVAGDAPGSYTVDDLGEDSTYFWRVG
ncbi:MAG: hypothetical protein ACC655_07055, partial [Rhodothermia bacterium]